MKKALIIGAAGFVGGYLIREIQRVFADSPDGMEVHATKLPQEQMNTTLAKVHDLDILRKEDVASLLREVRPDYIFHLAAQSSVAYSWKNPGLTIDVNVKGGANVLDAAKDLDYKPRILLIGSGEEYGVILPQETPIREDNRLRPGNLYAATKACQNMIGSIYAKAYQMDVMMVRAFNHIGPAQAPMFVVADFCKQVAEIEAGKREPVMRVGNLAAKRDFTDVRDVVRAYVLLIQHGQAGETYNVGSGHAIAIQEILDLILAQSKAEISVVVDPARLRPVDVPIIEADITKLKQATGWEPTIPIQETVRETVEYWRNVM